MADLTHAEAAQSIKIVGAAGSGTESNFADVTAANRLMSDSTTPCSVVSVDALIGVTNSSTVLLPANPSRRFAYISNNSGVVIWIMFGSAAVLNRGIRMASGSMYFINGSSLWTGAVNAIKSGGGSSNVDAFEATI